MKLPRPQVTASNLNGTWEKMYKLPAGKGIPFQAPALVLHLDATAAIFFEQNHLPRLPGFKS